MKERHQARSQQRQKDQEQACRPLTWDLDIQMMGMVSIHCLSLLSLLLNIFWLKTCVKKQKSNSTGKTSAACQAYQHHFYSSVIFLRSERASVTYSPKHTVQNRVVDFIHALCVFLGLLGGLLWCFRNWARRGVCGRARFKAAIFTKKIRGKSEETNHKILLRLLEQQKVTYYKIY